MGLFLFILFSSERDEICFGFPYKETTNGFIIIIIIKFGVSDKVAKENYKRDNLGLGVGVNLQSTESLPSKSKMRMMMLRHDNHRHRPFPSSETDHRGDHGPTCNRAPVTNDIYDVAASRAAASVVSSGAVVRSALQPFDISATSSTSTHTALKCPGLCS